MFGKLSMNSMEIEALALELELELLQIEVIEDSGVKMIPLSEIRLAHHLFQNRTDKFSEESVRKILEAVNKGTFQWSVLDPVTLWRNPNDGNLYMLSGHSRLEAFRRLHEAGAKINGKGFSKIPAKLFVGTQDEAKEIALNSNTLSTKETNLERAKYYRGLRDSGMSRKQVKEKAESLEGKNANLIIALSYLNPSGKAISALRNLEQGEETSKQIIQTVTYWLGEARKTYFDELTNSHEDELYEWLINTAYGTRAGQISRKNDFLAAIEKAIMRNTEFGVFDTGKPLNMNRASQKSPVELQFEQLVLDAQKEVAEARKARDMKLRYFTSQTTDRSRITEAIKEYDDRLRRAEIELQALLAKRDSVLEAAKNQISLFGLEYIAPEDLKGVESYSLGREESKSVNQIITDRLIKEMESRDGFFWQEPWLNKSYAARNFSTSKVYRGINYIWLNYVVQRESPYWLTFKQIDALGGKVKKGAVSEIVFFYTRESVKTVKRSNTEGELETVKVKTILDYPVIRYYKVFNSDDIEGIDFPSSHRIERNDAEKLESCEAIVANMPMKPAIYEDKVNQAFYRPALDEIRLPKIALFKSDFEYYSTLFHELVHSTGHKSRLNRFEKQKIGKGIFAKKANYAFEELVAEIGASFLCADSGILYYTIKNSAAYLEGWKGELISIMKEDDRFFLRAAAAAEEAATFINPLRESIQDLSNNSQTLVLEAEALELELELLNV